MVWLKRMLWKFVFGFMKGLIVFDFTMQPLVTNS